MAVVAPAPGDAPHHLISRESSIIVGTEDEEERVDQIERVLGQFMFQDQGMSVEQAFKYHNKNADDGLDEQELKLILAKAKCTFSEKEFKILMSRYDMDQSGGISSQEFQMTYRVGREAILAFVSEKDDQRAACSQIPQTILFFLILLVLISVHDMTFLKYSTESGVTAELLAAKAGGVKFSTIASVQDYWTWVEGVLISKAFIQQDTSTALDLPKEDWGFVGRYNKIMGAGVEMAQVRSVSSPCVIGQLNDVYGHKCKPTGMLDDKDFGLPECEPSKNITTSCWTSKDYSRLERFDHGGFTASDILCKTPFYERGCTYRENHGANFVFVLDYLSPKDVLKEQVRYYRNRRWVDEQTVELVASVALFNAEHGIFAQLVLSTTFDRGGEVINSWASESIVGDPYESSWWVLGLDVLWIGMVTAVMFGEFKEMKQERLNYLKDFWNVLDWIQCLLTIAIECYWIYIVVDLYSLRDAYENSHNPKLLEKSYNGTLSSAIRTEVAWQLDILLQNGVIYRYLTILNIMVLVIRFFKAFNVQPRLAIISKTLTKSVPDLAHFLVIFLCLFMTFVMFAHFVFGHIVSSYSQVGTAFFTTFRGFVAAPAINVPDLLATNAADIIPRVWTFPMAEVWLMMFMILLYLVVRSILLAIVIEAYKEAKSGSEHATTMWGQGLDMIRDMVSGLQGVIRLGDVIKILENALKDKHRVNMSMILESYATLKKQSTKKVKFNYNRSKDFSLILIGEFFSYSDRKLPAQHHLRALSAYARISELDGDFKSVYTRMDKLEEKFTKIHELLCDIKQNE